MNNEEMNNEQLEKGTARGKISKVKNTNNIYIRE